MFKRSNNISNINSKLISISAFLFFLIPIALLSGSFLPDLFISIISLLFLLITIRNKDFKYFKNSYFYFFLCFYFFLIFVSLSSENIFFSLKSTLFYFRFGIFTLATWFLIENKYNFIKIFSYFLIAAFVLAIIDGFYQYYNNVNLFGIVSDQNQRLTITFSDKLILGGFLSRLFPLLVALLIFKKAKNKKHYFFVALLFILTDVLIFISGERTALGLITLSTVFIIFSITQYRTLRIFTLIISMVLIFFISISNEKVKERNYDHTIYQLGIGSENGLNLFSPSHGRLISASYSIFTHYPIFGAGPNTFRLLCDNDNFVKIPNSCSTHPHSIYAQLLAETGLSGTIFISLLFFIILFKLLQNFYYIIFSKQRKLNDYQICLIICIMISLWPIAPSLNFFNNWINVIYFLPIGFLLQSVNQR